MQIRKIDQSEAKIFFDCMKSIDQETKFMMSEPGERQFDEDLIVNNLSNENDLFLGAFSEHEIVGFLAAKRGSFRRIRHSAYIVIGIRQVFQGQGIRTKLFDKLDEWARKNQVKRLELTVETQNTPAINLYEKQGFISEGIKKKTTLVDGEFIDEYMMAKLYI